MTLHVVLKALLARGHQVRVLTDVGGRAGTIDGIEVVVRDGTRTDADLARWSDVILAQLTARSAGLGMAARYRRPVAYYVHVGNPPRNALYGAPHLTIFSSHAVELTYPSSTPSIVVHPPISSSDYLTSRGAAITLVNLTAAKGAPLFLDLARRMPERQFLGVRGWGPQLLHGGEERNLELVGPLVDMRDAYRRTRVLLVPSVYESFGRVALEAAVSGIPVIAHPSRGVGEAMGDDAIYVDRGDPDGWQAAIEMLDAPDTYASWSERARTRFDAVSSWIPLELDALEQALRALVAR